MPLTVMDRLAKRFIERDKKRVNPGINSAWTGEAAEAGWAERPLYERNNWNVGEQDENDIYQALVSGERFTDRQVETKESTVQQCNEAVQKMQLGDCSYFSHLPPFIREYYGRRALRDFFGTDTFSRNYPLPPLDDIMKRRLQADDKLNDPVFRIALNMLIERNAVDTENNPIANRIREYDQYLNQLMVKRMLDVPEDQDLVNLQNKKHYTNDQIARKREKYEEKQIFVAKNLFMMQLGRIDIKNENGTTEPYRGKIAELIAHSSRTSIILPPGDSDQQLQVLEAWRKRARQRGGLSKYRLATHDFSKRVLKTTGFTKEEYKELKLKWSVKSKWFSLFRNYGIDIALGGLGRSFNGNDFIDDNGQFGHIYMCAKTGSEYECGSILMGFENSAPGATSGIGQHHGLKAVGHDVTAFYSGTTTVGSRYDGREVDLSHLEPEKLAMLLRDFEEMYHKLQIEAKTDEEAKNRLNRLNEQLTGDYMNARELANFMTSLGIGKDFAIESVKAGRSLMNAPYAHNRVDAAMYQVEANDVALARINNEDVARMDAVKNKANYVDKLRYQWEKMASHTAFSFLNSDEFTDMKNSFQKYLKAYDNIMAGKTSDGRQFRVNSSELSAQDSLYLRQCEKEMIINAKKYHDEKVRKKEGGFEKHKTQQGQDRDVMSMNLANFEEGLNEEQSFGEKLKTGFHTKKQAEEIKKDEARKLLDKDVEKYLRQAKLNPGGNPDQANTGIRPNVLLEGNVGGPEESNQPGQQKNQLKKPEGGMVK